MYATIIFASLLPALLSVIAWRQPFAWHRSKPQVFASSQNNLIEGEALKRIGKWACVKHCGACCKLGPLSSRPQVREYLNEAEYMQYKSMIGTDNWCKHFDKEQRICTIYESRPNFCNVSKSNVKKMFNIDAEEFADFCRFCCKENIIDVYGASSPELQRFASVQLEIEK